MDAAALAAPLVALLAPPTPFNGRYCAAAALANMAAAGPNARRAIVVAAALPPAVAMLSSGDGPHNTLIHLVGYMQPLPSVWSLQTFLAAVTLSEARFSPIGRDRGDSIGVL